MRNKPTREMVVSNAEGNGNGASPLSNQAAMIVRNMVLNLSLTRDTLLNKLIDPRRDIDDECGYPKELTIEHYNIMWRREGVATRVVSVFPQETWAMAPSVIEDEDPNDTPFEEALKDLERQHHFWSYLSRIDEVSGIGRFGILLLGINDGKGLDVPLGDINEEGNFVAKAGEHKLMYLRPLDESVVDIHKTEVDPRSPRFGYPVMYSVKLDNEMLSRVDTGELRQAFGKEMRIHWSRVIHIADNRKTSEIYGTPRMQTLFNRLYDIRKIAGGSGEMFWKGGFPGFSFEMDSNARSLTTDEKEELTAEVARYFNGLQRSLITKGITAKSLDPQVADPKAHMDVQLELIAITLGVPKRIFMGSEQAKLASSQDTASWNKRIARRQEQYVSPYIIRPFIDRLVALGVLPEVETYEIQWPDLDSPSDKDKAEVLQLQTAAFAKYVGGNVEAMIPLEMFLKKFVGMDEDEIKEVTLQAMKRERMLIEMGLDDTAGDDDDEISDKKTPKDEGD